MPNGGGAGRSTTRRGSSKRRSRPVCRCVRWRAGTGSPRAYSSRGGVRLGKAVWAGTRRPRSSCPSRSPRSRHFLFPLRSRMIRVLQRRRAGLVARAASSRSISAAVGVSRSTGTSTPELRVGCGGQGSPCDRSDGLVSANVGGRLGRLATGTRDGGVWPITRRSRLSRSQLGGGLARTPRRRPQARPRRPRRGRDRARPMRPGPAHPTGADAWSLNRSTWPGRRRPWRS